GRLHRPGGAHHLRRRARPGTARLPLPRAGLPGRKADGGAGPGGPVERLRVPRGQTRARRAYGRENAALARHRYRYSRRRHEFEIHARRDARRGPGGFPGRRRWRDPVAQMERDEGREPEGRGGGDSGGAGVRCEAGNATYFSPYRTSAQIVAWTPWSWDPLWGRHPRRPLAPARLPAPLSGTRTRGWRRGRRWWPWRRMPATPSIPSAGATAASTRTRRAIPWRYGGAPVPRR